MPNFFWAVGASVVVSLISLVGIFALLLKKNLLDRILVLLIGFSAGALIGGAFLHILPEVLEQSDSHSVFFYALLGFVTFFILERYFHWRHCHKGECDIHVFTYLNLIGDGIHNFTDGLIIAASFVVSIEFGVITSLAILFHEIPQEIGDFGVLLYGGFAKGKALFFNLLSALFCVLGTVIGFPLSKNIERFSLYLLPIVAGGFIYIAGCDLIPELHKQTDKKRGIHSIVSFLIGVLFILLVRTMHSH